jgi:hypothetical protein
MKLCRKFFLLIFQLEGLESSAGFPASHMLIRTY